MLTNTDHAPILLWFTGKGRIRAAEALTAVQASVDQGFWAPGVSRSARAALSKANVARACGKRLDSVLKEIDANTRYERDDPTRVWRRIAYQAVMTLLYGLPCAASLDQLASTRDGLADARATFLPGKSMRSMLDGAIQFVRVFQPLWDAMSLLDATRPPPVFTSLGVSPTLTKTLDDLGIAADVDAITYCPLEYYWVDVPASTPGGRVTRECRVRLLWPEGTRFGASRHARDHGRHRKCHACGHAIKNVFNWVPLILKAKDGGGPYGIWVGRDCAKSLFGVDMHGEFPVADGSGSAPAATTAA